MPIGFLTYIGYLERKKHIFIAPAKLWLTNWEVDTNMDVGYYLARVVQTLIVYAHYPLTTHCKLLPLICGFVCWEYQLISKVLSIFCWSARAENQTSHHHQLSPVPERMIYQMFKVHECSSIPTSDPYPPNAYPERSQPDPSRYVETQQQIATTSN